MIFRLTGKLVEKKQQCIILNVHDVYYEVMVPYSVWLRVDDTKDEQGNVHLIIYHYLQMSPSSGIPALVGFINEIERDFFQQFIKVSGIGPRAAVKALNKPISEITEAIDKADLNFLKSLPGIGNQKAKEIIAKLQGKVSRFALIKDRGIPRQEATEYSTDWQQEALSVLLQLQYTRQEASQMIKRALDRSSAIQSTEELLNEIYKQKVVFPSGS